MVVRHSAAGKFVDQDLVFRFAKVEHRKPPNVSSVLKSGIERRVAPVVWENNGIGCPRQMVSNIVRRTHPERRVKRLTVTVVRQHCANAAKPVGVTRQQGMAVDPLSLQSHPERPQIALFEDVRADTQRRPMVDGWSMYGTSVAKQHLVGDLEATVLVIKKIAQAGQLTAVVPRLPKAPIGDITSIEVDLEDPVSVRYQLIGQPGKKW